MTVDAIAVKHVRDWFASMADRPGAANRAMARSTREGPAMPTVDLTPMFRAEEWGLRGREN